MTQLGNWRSLDNDAEKYQAYLCSREWGQLKEAVRARCDGICERCETMPMMAVHHLTYARKYREDLNDLQGICSPCHDFVHGRSDFDPMEVKQWMRCLRLCNRFHVTPVPIGYRGGGLKSQEEADVSTVAHQLRQLHDVELNRNIEGTASLYFEALVFGVISQHPDMGGMALWQWCGYPAVPDEHYKLSLELVNG